MQNKKTFRNGEEIISASFLNKRGERVMKYITFKGDTASRYVLHYNTNDFPEGELLEIAELWTRIDDKGTKYYLKEIDETKEHLYTLRCETGSDEEYSRSLDHSVTLRMAQEIIDDHYYDGLEVSICTISVKDGSCLNVETLRERCPEQDCPWRLF